MKSTIILNSLLAGILLAAPLSAASVNVSFMTSGLPAGNYLFDFQFIDGDNATGNNTATISGFAVSNLTLGSLSTFGTVTGTDLVSGLTLTDGAMTEVDQAFTASSTAGNVSFTVNYTNNDTAPGPGDAFTFAITDTMLNSTRSAGNGAELEIDLTGGANATVNEFPADDAFGGFEPSVESGSVATPEDGTAALSGLGIFLLGVFATRRRLAKKV